MPAQIGQAMTDLRPGRNEMARPMKIGRTGLDRLLDPDNDDVHLANMQRAAAFPGRSLRVERA